MSVLRIDSAAVAELIEYASKPENWYRPSPDTPVPGDGNRHKLQMGDFRVVFTYTVALVSGSEPDRALSECGVDQVFRHLSISSHRASEGLYPSPEIVTEIARLFGFTGKLQDWIVGPVPGVAVIACAQQIPGLAVEF